LSGVLLDTHVLIWSLFDQPQMTPSARSWIDPSEPIYVSVVSIFEIDNKRRRGGGRAADALLHRMPRNMPAALPQLGFTLLAIDPDVAWRAANLPIDARDPWDRILVAQALALDVPLVSADGPLRASTQRHPKTSGVIVF
jgi:PIN domain nuclease of toxin-antitoxin system